MMFFGAKSVRARLGKTMVTLLSLARDTNRLVGNAITHQILVDVGAEVGVGREKCHEHEDCGKKSEDE